MKKLLYVDVPFANIKGGDKNRSNFLWNSLNREYSSDLLLILTPEYSYKPASEHTGYQNIYRITTKQSLPHQPAAIYQFHQRQKQKFLEILINNHYDIIVFRFLSTFILAEVAAKALPCSRIVIDVDMLFSRISELSWKDNKSISNRYHLLEMVKLRAFEQRVFRNDFTFYFTNRLEMEMAINRYQLHPRNGRVIPNMMPEADSREYPVNPETGRYILFFGSLDSMANRDSYLYLVKEIYPLLERILKERNLQIHITGKNPGDIYRQYTGAQINVIGAVDDIQSEIANSLFVFLPLRIASGTRTRILEAAALKKAVITTSIGVEGLDFAADEVIVKDDARSLANEVITYIQTPEIALQTGEKLYQSAVKRYSASEVKRQLLADLNQDIPTSGNQINHAKTRIAIVTNRFYPEVGGAETNIYFQAKLLAKDFDVTVICPKRIKKPRVEYTDGFKIIRLQDIFNIPARYPNLSAKTLCPELILHLIKTKYDIIQCFPALNYNNVLAFIAAKFKKTPYILCFFDFIDYAGLAKTAGRIDPDILKTVKPSLYQQIVLRGMDYAFAIADKEIQFIRKYNHNIEYSPVPILTDEYSTPVSNPRSGLGITETDFVFLSLGRISNIKGQDIALEAFGKACKEMPEAKLVFVGRTDYEKEFYTAMQEFIANNSLEDRVFFTGMVEREEVLGWLRYSDIHVIPVRFMNSGAVVVESWISDTPVLQSDVVDPNLVVDGQNGYLFQRENVEDCSKKMITAYQNRDLLNNMAKLGKELVRSKYTYDYLIGLYSNTYDKLISKKTGKR